MRAIWTTWRRESRKHPSVRVLTVAGLLGFALAPILIAAGMALLAQLVAGLAVAPLTLSVYICLLPTGPWPDDDDGGPGRGDVSPQAPDPRGEPDGGVDWERFEREFRAHVEGQLLVS